MSSIPIMRPRLPSADRLAPYLKSIDASRLYTNFGPLALSLEARLAEHYGLNEGTVATVANATLGLAIALAAQDRKSTRLNSSHRCISYAVFCLKKKKKKKKQKKQKKKRKKKKKKKKKK